jgi:hypothetical protein
MPAEWIQEVKRRVTIEQAAQEAHMCLVRNKSYTPCPACGAERRGSKDPRGPVGIRPDGQGWRCHRCDASGDTINLLSFAVAGTMEMTRQQWLDLHTYCGERGWCEPVLTGKKTVKRKLPPPPPPQVIPPPARPPGVEIEQLWSSAVSVLNIPAVLDWIKGRGLDPVEIADQDLARALSVKATVPGWARKGQNGRSWPSAGYQLLIPFRDHTGAVVAFQGRCTRSETPEGESKSLSPTGYQIAGAVMACPLAAQLLKTGQLPDWWPENRRLQVVVTEGIPDFLTWATRINTNHETAPAVVGLIAGSWNNTEGPKLAKRFPPAQWIIKTHSDPAGDKYAETIYRVLTAADSMHDIRRT